jgi:type IV pilus assembly protein PilW
MTCPRTHGARGLTLVELLVAMTVGLGVALTAARLMLLASAAYAAGAESAAVQDSGRFALELLGRAVRQGASFDPAAPPDAGAAPARIAGLDAHALARTAPALESPLPDAVNGSDVLAVRFPGAADGGILGCAGFPVAADDEGWSIFYVAKNAAGDAELRCKYHGAGGWTSEALVGGVDGFQVLYGIDTDTPADGAPNRYMNADAVLALDAALPVGVRSWWTRVTAVRVGLLLHGAHQTGTGGTAHYDLLGPVYAAAAGSLDRGSSLHEAALPAGLQRRERRLFATTFALPATPP